MKTFKVKGYYTIDVEMLIEAPTEEDALVAADFSDRCIGDDDDGTSVSVKYFNTSPSVIDIELTARDRVRNMTVEEAD